MADLTTQTAAVPAPMAPSPADRLLDVQAPQRPLTTPTFTIEVDGRQITGREGQTILEVCRDNGIEIPTLCYEPKLPGFGACRMCVVEVEGEDQPPISCSRACEPEMVVRTQTPRIRQIRKTNLELIFSDHNAYCLPPCQNKCPSHIDIPGFLKANAEGDFRESTRIFKRTIPFPSVLGRVCPAPCEEHCRRDEVDEAIAIRDSHRYAGDQVLKAQARGTKAPVPFEVQPDSGKRVAVIGSGPAGISAAYYLAIAGHEVTIYERDPAPGGMLRYGIPQYRLPKDEVLAAEYQGLLDLGVQDGLRRGARARLHHRRPAEPGLRRGHRGHRLLRHEQAGHPRRGRRGRRRRPRVPQASRPSACPIRAMPGRASWSSAAASRPWTAPAPPSARAPRR